MPYQRISAEKLSQSVSRQIELLILRGILRPGERLPAERDLAERLGVSRPSLREALEVLEAKGLLVTRPSAGAFVAEVLGNAFSPALIELFALYDLSPQFLHENHHALLVFFSSPLGSTFQEHSY